MRELQVAPGAGGEVAAPAVSPNKLLELAGPEAPGRIQTVSNNGVRALAVDSTATS